MPWPLSFPLCLLNTHTRQMDASRRILFSLCANLSKAGPSHSKKHRFSAGLQSPVLSDPPPPCNIFLIYSSPIILTSHCSSDTSCVPMPWSLPLQNAHDAPHRVLKSAQMSPRSRGLPSPCYVKLRHLTALYGLPLQVDFFSTALKAT